MIRLLVDCHVFDGKYQGTRTYLEGLYGKLTKHLDIDFYFCSFNTEKLKKTFGRADNIHYITLNYQNKFLRLIYEYPKIIFQYRINYAHFQYVVPLFKICKEIVTIHDLLFLDFPQYFPWSYRLKNRILFLLSAKRADLLFTVSDFSRQEIHKHFKMPIDKIIVTYNSVTTQPVDNWDTDIVNSLNVDNYILEVGRIEPRKNQLALVRAFVENELYKDYSLVLVGANDLKYSELDLYIKGLTPSMKAKIKQVTVSYADLLIMYQKAALFVFPSFAEGFGIPPLEALINNCPVLCSNATAMKEFGFPTKYTFDPYDQNELSIKMKKILTEPYDFSFKDNVLNKYSWKKSSDIMYEHLLKCCLS